MMLRAAQVSLRSSVKKAMARWAWKTTSGPSGTYTIRSIKFD